MQRGKLYKFGDWQKVHQLALAETAGEFPTLPVLSETLLYFELCTGQQTLCLDEMTGALLRDPGATVHILRAAAREVQFCGDSQCRIEDCVAALGTLGCLDALKDEAAVLSGLRPEIRKAWNHALVIAENCAHLARERGIDVSQRDAYLVGLYHELESFPSLLGWDVKSAHLSTTLLVQTWSLPKCVCSYFMEQQEDGQQVLWTELVRLAHLLPARVESMALTRP